MRFKQFKRNSKRILWHQTQRYTSWKWKYKHVLMTMMSRTTWHREKKWWSFMEINWETWFSVWLPSGCEVGDVAAKTEALAMIKAGTDLRTWTNSDEDALVYPCVPWPKAGFSKTELRGLHSQLFPFFFPKERKPQRRECHRASN